MKIAKPISPAGTRLCEELLPSAAMMKYGDLAVTCARLQAPCIHNASLLKQQAADTQPKDVAARFVHALGMQL